MNNATQNLMKAIQYVIFTEARSIDIYARLFTVRGIFDAYEYMFVVDTTTGLVTKVSSKSTDDEVVELAKAQWAQWF